MITSYDTMPLGIYKQVCDIIKQDEESIEARNVRIIALLNGMAEEELLNMPLAELRQYSDTLDFLHAEPKIGKPKKRYTIGQFVCEVQANPKRLTTAQYIDFKELSSVAGDKTEVLLSVFLVPHGHKYNDDYDIEEVQKAILEHLPVTEAQSILAFFLQRLHESTVNSMCCSLVLMGVARRRLKGEKKEEMTKKMEQMREAMLSYASGAGLTMSMLLPSVRGLLGLRSMSPHASNS